MKNSLYNFVFVSMFCLVFGNTKFSGIGGITDMSS